MTTMKFMNLVAKIFQLRILTNWGISMVVWLPESKPDAGIPTGRLTGARFVRICVIRGDFFLEPTPFY